MYKKYYDLRREGHTTQELADLAGVSYETMRKGIYRYAKKNRLLLPSELSPDELDTGSEKAFIERTKIHSNGEEEVTRLVPEEAFDNPENLLKELGYNPEAWDVIESSRAKWGKKEGKTFFSVRTRVRPKTSEITQIELLQSILTEVSKYKPNPILYPTVIPNKKQSLVIPLYDLHYSVDNLPYFRKFLGEIHAEMGESTYEEITIILGGDALEHDNFVFTTEAGTRTEGTNIRKDYVALYHFLAELFNLALDKATKVRYYNVRGNHSPSMDWTLSFMLQELFPQIEMDIEPDSLKAISVYDTFIALEHGDIKSAKRVEESIGYLYRDLFAECNFHYIFTGHLHGEKEILSDTGTFVKIRFPSPADSNEWSKKHIYHSQFRGLRCLVIEEGEGIKKNFYFRNGFLTEK